MKLRIGDTVKVNIGSSKGKSGKVQKIIGKENKVVVEGINVVKRHLKNSGRGVGGGIIEKTLPLDYSKVNLVCPKCDQPTRIGFIMGGDNKKIRVCRKCDQPID